MPMVPPESVAGTAGDVPPLIKKIAGLQNLKEYAELNWSGYLRGLPGPGQQEPLGDPHAHSSASTT